MVETFAVVVNGIVVRDNTTLSDAVALQNDLSAVGMTGYIVTWTKESQDYAFMLHRDCILVDSIKVLRADGAYTYMPVDMKHSYIMFADVVEEEEDEVIVNNFACQLCGKVLCDGTCVEKNTDIVAVSWTMTGEVVIDNMALNTYDVFFHNEEDAFYTVPIVSNTPQFDVECMMDTINQHGWAAFIEELNALENEDDMDIEEQTEYVEEALFNVLVYMNYEQIFEAIAVQVTLQEATICASFWLGQGSDVRIVDAYM